MIFNRKKKEISKTRKIITYILFAITVVPVTVGIIQYVKEEYISKNKLIPKTVIVDGYRISMNDSYKVIEKAIEKGDYYIFNQGSKMVEPGLGTWMELRDKDDDVYVELLFRNYGAKEKSIEECRISAIEVTKSRVHIDSEEHTVKVSDGVKLGDNEYILGPKYYYRGTVCSDGDGLTYFEYKDKKGNTLNYLLDENKIYCVEIHKKPKK